MTVRRCRFMWWAGAAQRVCLVAALLLTFLALYLAGVK